MEKLKEPYDIALMFFIDSVTHDVKVVHQFNRDNDSSNKRYAELLNALCGGSFSLGIFEKLSVTLLKHMDRHAKQVYNITQHWNTIRASNVDEPVIPPSKFLNLHFDKPE